VTAEDAVVTGRLTSQNLIDHICVSADLATAATFTCWEPVDADGVRMSDHPGVVVTV
jgi:hypothetical protein